MTYVPGTVSELYDYLVWLHLSAPDFHDDVIPDTDIESAFATVYESLARLKSKLGDSGFARLRTTADDAKRWFVAGDNVAGGYMIQHMAEYIRLKKFKTNELVIDDSRFQS